jgi:hypothetical protein
MAVRLRMIRSDQLVKLLAARKLVYTIVVYTNHVLLNSLPPLDRVGGGR